MSMGISVTCKRSWLGSGSRRTGTPLPPSSRSCVACSTGAGSSCRRPAVEPPGSGGRRSRSGAGGTWRSPGSRGPHRRRRRPGRGRADPRTAAPSTGCGRPDPSGTGARPTVRGGPAAPRHRPVLLGRAHPRPGAGGRRAAAAGAACWSTSRWPGRVIAPTRDLAHRRDGRRRHPGRATSTTSPCRRDAMVGAAGLVHRAAGFAVGGAGVAAVWWGGAAGVLDARSSSTSRGARRAPARAPGRAARPRSRPPTRCWTAPPPPSTPPRGADHVTAVAVVRSAVERPCERSSTARRGWSGRAAQPRPSARARLADLALYVRQHHGERDHAALGARGSRPDRSMTERGRTTAPGRRAGRSVRPRARTTRGPRRWTAAPAAALRPGGAPPGRRGRRAPRRRDPRRGWQPAAPHRAAGRRSRWSSPPTARRPSRASTSAGAPQLARGAAQSSRRPCACSASGRRCTGWACPTRRCDRADDLRARWDRCWTVPTPTSPPGRPTRTPTTAPPGSPRPRRPVTAHGWSYPIWMWAWTPPDDPSVPWDRAHVSRSTTERGR